MGLHERQHDLLGEEPKEGDGLAGWNYFNGYLKSRWATGSSVVFPVYKYLKKTEENA